MKIERVNNTHVILTFSQWRSPKRWNTLNQQNIDDYVLAYMTWFNDQVELDGGWVQLTHHLHTTKGLISTDAKPKDFESISLIGHDIVESERMDIFKCVKDGNIHIYYGQLNSGHYPVNGKSEKPS